MAQYRIQSSQGVDLGTFTARTAVDALDEMALAAGYASHRVACEVTGEDASDWTESRYDFLRGSISLLVTEVS